LLNDTVIKLITSEFKLFLLRSDTLYVHEDILLIVI